MYMVTNVDIKYNGACGEELLRKCSQMVSSFWTYQIMINMTPMASVSLKKYLENPKSLKASFQLSQVNGKKMSHKLSHFETYLYALAKLSLVAKINAGDFVEGFDLSSHSDVSDTILHDALIYGGFSGRLTINDNNGCSSVVSNWLYTPAYSSVRLAEGKVILRDMRANHVSLSIDG